MSRLEVRLQMSIPSNEVKQLLDNVNVITDRIRNDENIYKDFLRWSGLFINDQGDGKKYSIANQLLIYGYNSNARLVKEEKDWNSFGISVVKQNQAIYLLKKTDNGYTERRVYDISATNAEPLKIIEGKDWGSKCEALISSSPCRIEFDNYLFGQRSNYLQQQNIIKVGKGFMSYENVIASLGQEYGHYHICQDMKRIFDINIEEAKKGVKSPNEKEVFYKFIEGKYYEISESDNVKKDKNGRLFVFEVDEKGNLYKAHVEKRIKKVRAEDQGKEFRYSKTEYQHMAYAVSFIVSVTLGIDPKVYKFTNEVWKDKELFFIRNELDVITMAGRKILLDYNQELIRQKNAVYTDSTSKVNSMESEVV